MDDDDAQFLVVELAAGVNCQDLSETLGTQPFEHANYQWLVLGSTPAGNAVVAAVAGAEVAPEPTKRLAGWLQERLKAAGAAHGVAPYRMTGEAAPAPAPVQPAQRRPAPVQPAQRRARVAPAEAYRRRRAAEAAQEPPRAAEKTRDEPIRWAVPPPPPPSRILERPPTRGKGRQMAADFPPPPPSSQPPKAAVRGRRPPPPYPKPAEPPKKRPSISLETSEAPQPLKTPPAPQRSEPPPPPRPRGPTLTDLEKPTSPHDDALLRRRFEKPTSPVEQFLARERAASPPGMFERRSSPFAPIEERAPSPSQGPSSPFDDELLRRRRPSRESFPQDEDDPTPKDPDDTSSLQAIQQAAQNVQKNLPMRGSRPKPKGPPPVRPRPSQPPPRSTNMQQSINDAKKAVALSGPSLPRVAVADSRAALAAAKAAFPSPERADQASLDAARSAFPSPDGKRATSPPAGPLSKKPRVPGPASLDVAEPVAVCVKINQCVGCRRRIDGVENAP